MPIPNVTWRMKADGTMVPTSDWAIVGYFHDEAFHKQDLVQQLVQEATERGIKKFQKEIRIQASFTNGLYEVYSHKSVSPHDSIFLLYQSSYPSVYDGLMDLFTLVYDKIPNC